MKVPFGRYRGTPLEDIPDDYLTWLLTIELRPFSELLSSARRVRVVSMMTMVTITTLTSLSGTLRDPR